MPCALADLDLGAHSFPSLPIREMPPHETPEAKTGAVQPFGVPKDYPKVMALCFPRPVFPEFITYQFFNDRNLIQEVRPLYARPPWFRVAAARICLSVVWRRELLRYAHSVFMPPTILLYWDLRKRGGCASCPVRQGAAQPSASPGMNSPVCGEVPVLLPTSRAHRPNRIRIAFRAFEKPGCRTCADLQNVLTEHSLCILHSKKPRIAAQEDRGELDPLCGHLLRQG